MTPLVPKARPIIIPKPEDFPPRPAPPEPGPELPAQPRQSSDLLSKIAQLEDTIAWLVAPADDVPDPAYADYSGTSFPWTRPADAPLLPAPDALLSDYGPVGTDDITGDLLLDAFEDNEAETAAIVQTLSALRLKHLSEQLNVERARLDREHQATGVANPRSASIDRLLGLLTRRGEV